MHNCNTCDKRIETTRFLFICRVGHVHAIDNVFVLYLLRIIYSPRLRATFRDGEAFCLMVPFGEYILFRENFL